MRILVVAHVFYSELWSELADCIRNIDGDLVVTYVDEVSVVEARRDFPEARFLLCENRGYDIWPFLKAVQSVDLGKYDLVVKLHTKRDIICEKRNVVGHTLLNGSAWREHLLSFVKTPETWRLTLAKFGNPKVGMVADRHVIFLRRDALKEKYCASFDEAVHRLNAEWGIPARRGGRFVGGTMFAVRASILRPFAAYAFTPDMFSVSGPHEPSTYAHLMERMLGLAVEGLGYRISAFDGSVRWRRFWCAVGKFFYDSRWSERRRSIRICRITVYLKRLCP
mgnify:CR=1 FL=1